MVDKGPQQSRLEKAGGPARGSLDPHLPARPPPACADPEAQGGGEPPISIPTVRDRVVQTATVLGRDLRSKLSTILGTRKKEVSRSPTRPV